MRHSFQLPAAMYTRMLDRRKHFRCNDGITDIAISDAHHALTVSDELADTAGIPGSLSPAGKPFTGQVYFCESGEKELFRSFDLPAPIDVDRVTAHLEKGVLHVTAPTTQPASQAASCLCFVSKSL